LTDRMEVQREHIMEELDRRRLNGRIPWKMTFKMTIFCVFPEPTQVRHVRVSGMIFGIAHHDKMS
jgi:hypothetical protein